jgi:hypothetical protein
LAGGVAGFAAPLPEDFDSALGSDRDGPKSPTLPVSGIFLSLSV